MDSQSWEMPQESDDRGRLGARDPRMGVLGSAKEQLGSGESSVIKGSRKQP